MNYKFWIFVIIVLAVIAAGIWVGKEMIDRHEDAPQNAAPYAAVYLSSGDIYYGKISWQPVMHLTDVWYLEKTVAGNGAQQYGIAPFTNAIWKPIDEIYINESNVLFWTYLASTSPVAQAMANPSLFQTQQLEQQLNQPQPSFSVTSTGATGTNANKK